MPRRPSTASVALLLLVISGCAPNASDPVGSPTSTPTPSTTPTSESVDQQAHPDVIDAQLTAGADGTWSLAATLSSPYDTPERYADAFRALAPDGTELGVRILTHDHADEQPFTRTLTGLVIPEGVSEIEVQGRDQRNGWGGLTVRITVPR